MHCKCNAYLVHCSWVMEMAEFCLECWNEINESNDTENMYFLSKELDLCEECGQWKPVIIAAKPAYTLRRFLLERLTRKKDLP